jgi:hypothetical protein
MKMPHLVGQFFSDISFDTNSYLIDQDFLKIVAPGGKIFICVILGFSIKFYLLFDKEGINNLFLKIFIPRI